MTNAGKFVIISVVGLSLIIWICWSQVGDLAKLGECIHVTGRVTARNVTGRVTSRNVTGRVTANNVTGRVTASNVTGRVTASKCAPDKYRGVSESFWDRSSKREALERCAEQDFFNLIRVQGGAQPKLLSARTQPVKEALYGDKREYVVPNIVHFIWFKHPLEFKFRTYLTYLSVHKFIKPHYILLHGDVTPTGHWWKRTVADVPNIYHVHVDDKKSMFGQNFAYPSQHSDVLRLYVILGK